MGQYGLVNYNNSGGLNIARTGYTGKSTAEWKTSNGAKTYDHSVVYAASDFCDTKTTSCTVTLYVNWVAHSYTVTFNGNGGSGGTGSSTVTYDSTMGSITKPSRSYTVTFNYNGNGSSNTSSTATYTFICTSSW